MVVDRWPLLANGSVDLASLPLSDSGGHTERRDLLASLWPKVLGVQRVRADESYGQSFSFVEVVAQAREAGFPIPDRQVSPNRVLATPHTDMVVAAVNSSNP